MNSMNIWHYIKFHRFNSLFLRNFLLILSLLIFSIVGIGLCVNYYNTLKFTEEIKSNNLVSLTLLKKSVDSILFDANSLAYKFETDQDTKSFFAFTPSQKAINNWNFISVANNIKQKYTFYMLPTRNNFHISLYSFSSNYVFSSLFGFDNEENVLPPSEKELYHSNFGIAQNIVSYCSTIYLGNPKIYLALHNYLPISSPVSSKNGVISIYLKYDDITNLITNNNGNKNDFYISYDDKIIYSKNSSDLGQNILDTSLKNEIINQSIILKSDKDNHVISGIYSDYPKIKYHLITPVTQYQNQKNQMTSFIIALILLFIFLSIIITFFVSMSVYSPIEELLSLVDNPSAWIDNPEDLQEIKWSESKNLISYLRRSFLENKQVNQTLNDNIKLLNDAQATVLQNQITPHFLYNTLENINWSVIGLTGDENPPSTMIKTLSELLRKLFNNKSNYVTVENEQTYCMLYIEIQKYRFYNKFDVIWDISPEIKNLKILKFTLQPIIENSIIHAFVSPKSNGLIRVTGRIHKNRLLFEIYDNGVGIPSNELSKIIKERSTI